jgi:peptidoglycan hydrolase CwlO-like protein
MSKKVKVLLIVLIVIVSGFFAYNYVMTSGARDLETEKSEFTVEASKIIEEFTNNSESATTKYLNKAVEISGKVTAIDKNVVTINETISCQLKVKTAITLNSDVVIKGRVTGYDDLLEELKLDQCLIVK